MTLEDLEEIFNRKSKFDPMEVLETPQDLYVFTKINSLVPGSYDILGSAEHDVVYLSVDPEELANAASEEDIEELKKYGVFLSTEGLFIFV